MHALKEDISIVHRRNPGGPNCTGYEYVNIDAQVDLADIPSYHPLVPFIKRESFGLHMPCCWVVLVG